MYKNLEISMVSWIVLFFASTFSKKLHPKMENVASPFWRKLQVARQGCQALPKQFCRHINDIAIAL